MIDSSFARRSALILALLASGCAEQSISSSETVRASEKRILASLAAFPAQQLPSAIERAAANVADASPGSDSAFLRAVHVAGPEHVFRYHSPNNQEFNKALDTYIDEVDRVVPGYKMLHMLNESKIEGSGRSIVFVPVPAASPTVARP
jgi:hypothetical protein